MIKKVLIAVGVIAVLLAAGGVAYYFYLTAEVPVSSSLPVAPTLVVPAPIATTLPLPASPTATVAPTTVAPTLAASPTAAIATATATPAATPAASTATPLAAQVYRLDASKSQASYEVKEVFLNGNRLVTAVGTTRAVAGELLLDRTNPKASQIGEIVIDISQLRSDNSQRDNALRRQWLESARYPRATFKTLEISNLPPQFPEGKEFTFTISGDMTVRNITRRVSWEVKATLEGNNLSGTAVTRLKMSSFGVNPPDLAGFLKSDDELTLKLDFVASPPER